MCARSSLKRQGRQDTSERNLQAISNTLESFRAQSSAFEQAPQLFAISFCVHPQLGHHPLVSFFALYSVLLGLIDKTPGRLGLLTTLLLIRAKLKPLFGNVAGFM